MFRAFKRHKSYLKHLNYYTNLQKITQVNIQPEVKTLNLYNITNKNFYESQEKWYSKSLHIVGQNVSEFSVDLKPIESLTCFQPITSEFIKIEFRKKNKRKTRSRKKRTSIINFWTLNTKKTKKQLKYIRKQNYKLPSFTNFKKNPLLLESYNSILHEKRVLTSFIKKPFTWQKKQVKYSLSKSFRLINLVSLIKSIRQQKFKTKRTAFTLYQRDNININHTHKNPYNYLSRPKLNNSFVDATDHVSTILTSTLDNLKSNHVKRTIHKLPTKIRKLGHVKWFHHFSRKNKKVYLLRYTNSKVVTLKTSQPQWNQLLRTNEPILHLSTKLHNKRYSSNLINTNSNSNLTQQNLKAVSKGFTKWGSQIRWQIRKKSKVKNSLQRLTKHINFTKYTSIRSTSPKLRTRKILFLRNNQFILLKYFLKRSKKSLVKHLKTPRIKCLNFKPQVIKSSNRPYFQIKSRKYLNKWLFTNKVTSSALKLKHSTVRGRKKRTVFKKKHKETFLWKKSNNSAQFYKIEFTPTINTNSYLIPRSATNLSFKSTLPRKMDSLKLHTRIGKPFILNSSIMFFTKLLLKTKQKPYTFKYIFKKKLFSFLYPNEVRNALLYKKKQFVFYKLIFNKSRKLNRSNFYSTSKMKKVFKYHQLKISLNSQYDFFTQKSLTDTTFRTDAQKFAYYTGEVSEVEDKQSFNFRGMNNNFKLSEVKISRIQFKPGYQRLWRRARTALKESLQVKFIYQQKLSRYIVRFFRQTNYYTFSRSEMELQKTIIYSRLLPDVPTVTTFLNQSLVYLNGKLITNAKTIVLQNDVIQFIISQWYYIAFRWVANWTLKRNKKFKRLVYKKGLASRHKVMKLKKQKSYYTPHWIYLARYDLSDVKSYLEVDYLTLSTFIIYNPYLLHYFAPDETPDWRATIYRLYNWKYIT